eukprot:NODE_10138_length_1374_cov_5.236568.p2 GENE.NODE_10138_length_1374_cov_5.236568~~NODE_10138_length_1374_cov_5.236568.p2  ORF type:complete len:148 (+),score=28.50 NODE_10138_length_1374_cov_5.236568:136-579(+)
MQKRVQASATAVCRPARSVSAPAVEVSRPPQLGRRSVQGPGRNSNMSQLLAHNAGGNAGISRSARSRRSGASGARNISSAAVVSRNDMTALLAHAHHNEYDHIWSPSGEATERAGMEAVFAHYNEPERYPPPPQVHKGAFLAWTTRF